MQHTQFNFVIAKLCTKVGTLSVVLALMAAQPLWAGTQPAKSDPLLDGGPTSPCAAGTDYAAGTDALGGSVTPADVGAAPVPVPDAIAIPLSQAHQARQDSRSGPRDSAYVSIDGRKLAPLLNPAPCRAPAP